MQDVRDIRRFTRGRLISKFVKRSVCQCNLVRKICGEGSRGVVFPHPAAAKCRLHSVRLVAYYRARRRRSGVVGVGTIRKVGDIFGEEAVPLPEMVRTLLPVVSVKFPLLSKLI